MVLCSGGAREAELYTLCRRLGVMVKVKGRVRVMLGFEGQD